MRLLILSFFTVLLGYSLLFDQQEETKLIKRPQEVSPSSAVMAPNISDSISYSYMNWLSITPGLHLLREQKPVFRCLK